MKVALRVVLALLVLPGAMLFLRWTVVPKFGLPWAMRDPVAWAGALGIAFYVFRQSRSAPGSLASSVLFGAAAVGGVGFAAGILIPLLLQQSANQGPLLGLFITGPIGTVAGAIGGAVRWHSRRLNATTAPPSPS